MNSGGSVTARVRKSPRIHPAVAPRQWPPSLPSATVEKGVDATRTVGKQAEPTPNNQPVRLNEGQQGKHIEGSNAYIPTRSTLTANPKALLERFAGRGQQIGRTPVGQAGSKESFDAGEQVIGTYRTQGGQSAPTTRGIIHFSNRGAHIVPAAPRNWQP
jgi:Bacterial toxin 50